MLLREATAAGADVREQTGVRKILRLGDGDVAVETDAGEQIRARYLLDASGQSTVVARHLGTRHALPDDCFQKVAYFAHFENVKRLPGREEGHPAIVMCEEGWFWLINIDETRSSPGPAAASMASAPPPTESSPASPRRQNPATFSCSTTASSPTPAAATPPPPSRHFVRWSSNCVREV
jgi:glycine/D-amino acid oxidase-like deaminating enzyme